MDIGAVLQEMVREIYAVATTFEQRIKRGS